MQRLDAKHFFFSVIMNTQKQNPPNSSIIFIYLLPLTLSPSSLKCWDFCILVSPSNKNKMKKNGVTSSYRRISASLNPLIFSRGIVRGLPRFFGLFLSEIESLSDPEYLLLLLRLPSLPLKLIWNLNKNLPKLIAKKILQD